MHKSQTHNAQGHRPVDPCIAITAQPTASVERTRPQLTESREAAPESMSRASRAVHFGTQLFLLAAFIFALFRAGREACALLPCEAPFATSLAHI